MEVIFVNTIVIILMVAIGVIVKKVLNFQMVLAVLISMNVILTMVAVIISVLIRLDHISVSVKVGTYWMKMVWDVLVINM